VLFYWTSDEVVSSFKAFTPPQQACRFDAPRFFP
jgi:hypothetical protein